MLCDPLRCVGPITVFDVTEDYPTRIAAEVKGFEPTDWMPKKKLRECARFIPFAVAATQMAVQDAGLELSDEERERAGVFIGVGMGGLEALQEVTRTVDSKGPRRVRPHIIPSLIGNMASAQATMALGIRAQAGSPQIVRHRAWSAEPMLCFS